MVYGGIIFEVWLEVCSTGVGVGLPPVPFLTGRPVFQPICHASVGLANGTANVPFSRVCLSVCLSVTLRYCIKTAKRRITQITPHDSPMTLVF